MKEGQYLKRPYPTGNRTSLRPDGCIELIPFVELIQKHCPCFSARVNPPEDESEVYQKSTSLSKHKCESLDERNIVVSSDLLAQVPSIVKEVAQVPEEHLGGDLPEKILLPLRSSTKALNEHKNKQLNILSTQPFHKRHDLSACKQCSGPNTHSTSLNNSRAKSLVPLTQRVFSAACAEPRKDMAVGRNQEISKPADHLVSASSMLWPHKPLGLQTRASGKLQKLCLKSAVNCGYRRMRLQSGNVSVAEAGPIGRRSACLDLGHEVGRIHARHICASWQKKFQKTHQRLRDCSWGPGGYCLRLSPADYRRPIYREVTQGRVLPSTHVYLWERDSRDSSQQACSQFRPFVWKSEGEERGTTGASGHPAAGGQPDIQAGRAKDIRCQTKRQQNPEPPLIEQQQDHDFTLKHILQVLQCR